jgi:hypothetical protein
VDKAGEYYPVVQRVCPDKPVNLPPVIIGVSGSLYGLCDEINMDSVENPLIMLGVKFEILLTSGG